jgi:hypothetical protein
MFHCPDDSLAPPLAPIDELEIAVSPYVWSTLPSLLAQRPVLIRCTLLQLVHSNLLNATQDDPSTHSARQEMLKIISAYVPTLAKLERWELSATCHVLNFFAAAFEEFCHIAHVEHSFVSSH